MDTVKITSDGTGCGTTIEDAATGQRLNGIAAATVRISADDLVRADIELLSVKVEVAALPEFLMAHPVTGEMKTVQRIVFTDGSEFQAAEPDRLAVKTVDGKVHYLPR